MLRDAFECYKRIREYRQGLYKMETSNRISDTNVINVSQQLDKEIAMLQKIMLEARPECQ